MRKTISFLLICIIYIGMFSPLLVRETNAQKTSGKTIKTNMNIDLPNGLQFRLSEGVEGADKREKTPPVSGDTLSENEKGNLLKRLPQIKTDTNDQTDFAKRIGTLPAPKTGNTIPVKFPSDEQRSLPVNNTNTQKLEVVRFSPEGEVKLAPDLNITFSQPMVAVTSQEEAAKYVPVELSPSVEGKWRWLGTKTLMFDTTKRFPMATKFTARVPAGTKSANGQATQKDFVWTFTTPPPKVEQMIPNAQITNREAIIFVSFDQQINPQEVLKTISVTGAGKKLPIRLATQEEIDKDVSISYYAKQAQPNRWLAFRAVNSDGLVQNALPAASPVSVTIEKGTASAEGPLTTTAAQSFSFQTYSALKFNKAVCNWEGNTNCSPFDQWYLEFNNPIDAANFTKEMVKIEPPVENLNIYPSGNYVYIQGYKKGRTTYTITVDGSVKDTFGQILGKPATATIKVGSAEQNLYTQGGSFTVLDPTAKLNYSIFSTNMTAVKLKVSEVEPQNWSQFQKYLQYINYDDDTKKPAKPGRLLADKIINIEKKADEMVETRIDLSEYLPTTFGNLIIEIEPTVRRDKYDRTRIFTWIQATQIGLDAFVDNSELVGFATDLKTGKPLTGVELSIYPNGKDVKALSENIETPTKSWWEWLTSWGTSEESIKATETIDENGEVSETEIVNEAQSNRTSENGILRLPLPEEQPKSQNLLIAKKGKDTAFLPENTDYYWQDYGTWSKSGGADSLRWFVFDDRGMYRPKEEVSVKGYIRIYEAGKFGDIGGLGDKPNNLTFSVKDAQNNEIGKGEATINSFGAFDFKFKLPDNANLGYARIDISSSIGISGSSYSHQFQIQEFRRPEFEVTAKNETEAPYFVKDSANVAVEAKYFAGGGLANADVNWVVRATPTNYTPPNRGDFTFGTWVPWWRGYGDYENSGNASVQTFKGLTDAAGKHVLKIDFESVNPPRPYAISANASVQDVNRQTWASNTNLLVHPSSFYVGLKIPRYFVNKGENINVESIVSDIDGNLIGNRDVEIKAVLKDWTFDKGTWKEEVLDEQNCSIKSASDAQKCVFPAKQGGRYTITARVLDDKERPNETEITVWVAGAKVEPKRTVEQEEAQLIPNKKEYQPGDVAEILVMSPFPGAEGVLTLRRDGIVKTERFTIKDSSIVLKIPIEEKYLPNIYAQVDLVGATVRTDDKGETDEKLAKRPAFASGQLNLSVSTASRELNVTAEPQEKTLAPGGETKVAVEVKDKNGEPVSNTEIAVVVVDESVLALSRYDISNPLGVFYTARGTGTRDFHLRKDILLGNQKDIKQQFTIDGASGAGDNMIMQEGAVMAKPSSVNRAMKTEAKKDKSAADDKEMDKQPVDNNGTPINLRENFNALAFFAPSVKTDSSGKAVVTVKLPDNLTRYRITAVSVDSGKRFGKGESNITARQPLMVRPSAPRFMNFGDKIELPVVVQNQTDKDMTVAVAVRATNAQLTGESGKRVVIKGNDRAEIRFPVSADKAGTARFQIAVNSGSFSDAAEISLPVWTPATTEAFATYGTTDQNGAIFQPVQTPGDVYPQFGGLEVTTSSTQLQELTDAFIYLYRYPYECSEQISSRMISIAALRDVLTAFKSKDMPTADEIKANFDKDIRILQSRQREDGSFGLWKRERERYEYPFLTVHVAHALALAKQKGYNVPDEMLNKTKPFLKNIESHIPANYPTNVRWTISAYALYVRDLMGDKDAVKARALYAQAAFTKMTIDKMPFEALGWILSVLAGDKTYATDVEDIKRFLMNRTTETAATANFVTDYGDGAWLIMYSNRRADGVLLEALIKADPKNDLIPKLVRGLLDHRTKGAWSNTQENVFILLALDKYFNTFEKVTPDFAAQIWLGQTYAGEQIFKGRSIDSNLLNIPMSYLVEQGGTSNLILDKEGAGRIYYRIGMKYAPKNLKLQSADYGFEVLRKYEAIDDAEDVKQNSDGSWTIKSGSRVRVRLTMVAQARRYHVALVDNLPAGLEILNPGLAVTEELPADTQNTGVTEFSSRSFGGYWWWNQYWFEHQNFRDERAEAFASLLWEGVYNYSYVTRATTPGEFVVPPAKAEEMYHPETFGRTGTDFVKVQ
jgi:uncharacterized protein YfaS (alpha-2-macroglobulin family)